MTRTEMLLAKHLIEPEEVGVLQSLETKGQGGHGRSPGFKAWNKDKHITNGASSHREHRGGRGTIRRVK